MITYTGIGQKEIELTSSDTYDVTISSKTKDLQEVVVIGYGTQKRAFLTASVATIKAPDIENRPYTSVDQMFENFYGYSSQSASQSAPSSERTWTFSPVFESGWSENFLNLRAILPAVAENDVRVSVQRAPFLPGGG